MTVVSTHFTLVNSEQTIWLVFAVGIFAKSLVWTWAAGGDYFNRRAVQHLSAHLFELANMWQTPAKM